MQNGISTLDQLKQHIKSNLPNQVRVRGKVLHTNLSGAGRDRCRFATIEGDNGMTVEVVLPFDTALTLSDLIVVEGRVQLKGTFKLQIKGTLIGLPVHSNNLELKWSRPSRTSLSTFGAWATSLDKQYVITALMTKIAKGDFLSACSEQAGSRIQFVDIGDRDHILRWIEYVATENTQLGLMIARGGGESLGKLWNDDVICRALERLQKPFYTAIGHAEDKVLADELADEHFTTPSMLGTKWLAACTPKVSLTATQMQEATRQNIPIWFWILLATLLIWLLR